MQNPARPTGIKVRVPKGTEITGTFPKGRRVAGRPYIVDAFRLSPGYLPRNAWDIRNGVGRVASVTFVGSGGYWCEVAAEDVACVQGHHRWAAFGASADLVTRERLAEAVASFDG